MALIIGVVIVLLILFGFLCYKKAPPTEAIVVTGFGLARPKVVCGKGTFVLPVLQRADRLNMRLLKIDVKTPETGVKTQNGVSLWIDSVVTIQVYSENSTVLDEEVKASGLKDAKAYIMFQLRRKSKQFLEYDTGRRESVLIQENSAVIRRPKGQRIEVGTSGLRDNQTLRYRPAQLQAGWTCGDDEELLPPVLVRQRTPQARGGRAGLSSPFRPKRNVIGSRAKQKRNGRCRIPQWKR